MRRTPITEEIFVKRLNKKGQLRFAKDGNALVKTLKKFDALAVREHVSGFVTPTMRPPLQKAVLAVSARRNWTVSFIPAHLVLSTGSSATYILVAIRHR